MKHSVTELPFNRFMGIESCRDGELLLRQSSLTATGAHVFERDG